MKPTPEYILCGLDGQLGLPVSRYTLTLSAQYFRIRLSEAFSILTQPVHEVAEFVLLATGSIFAYTQSPNIELKCIGTSPGKHDPQSSTLIEISGFEEISVPRYCTREREIIFLPY